MRTILGPHTTRDESVRHKSNKELEGENIIRLIKAQRLQWERHLMRRKLLSRSIFGLKKEVDPEKDRNML